LPRPPHSLLRLLPGLAGVGALAWWLLKDGGYGETVWLPGLLLFLALGAVTAIARVRDDTPLPLVAVAALGLFGGYVAWSALSILWAEDPGLALAGTLRAALYLGVLLLFSALPWRLPDATRLLTAVVLGVTALGIVAVLRLGVSAPADLGDLLLQSRLAWPLSYQNANAALWTMAALPALVLASRREISWALRPVLLAAAALLLDLGLLSQSRGWLFTLPLMALAAIALVPGRLRLLPWAAALGLAAAVAADPMLAIYRAGGEDMPANRLGAVAEAIDSATGRLALACVLALALGALLVLADRRWHPSAVTVRRSGWVVTGLAVLAMAGGAVAVVAATDGDPGERLSNAWSDFKANRTESAGQGRFGAFGSSRYDFWRVGIDEFLDHPLGGIGQDNFAAAYLQRRNNLSEEPRWTHSVELRMLVHTGLGGALLFAGFLVCLVATAVRGPRPRGWVPAALLLPALVWILHGSVDWLWEYPALSGLALAPAGVAIALSRQVSPPRRWGRSRLPAVVTASVLAAVVAVVAGTAFLSERLQDRAEVRWVTDPKGAFDDLDRAASLAPLSGRPDLVAGLIALRRGEIPRARGYLDRAADRDPGGWFIRLTDGIAASAGGDEAAARAAFTRARELNPKERLVGLALRRASTKRPLTLDEATRELTSRVNRRFGSR
jgi:hypothetical protein